MKKSNIVLMHTGYWFLYLLLIVTFLLILPHTLDGRSFAKLSKLLFFSPVTLLFILPCALSFYGFYLFLFSKFLQQRKIFLLVTVGILFCIITAICTLYISQQLFNSYNKEQMAWADKIAMLLFISILCAVHGIIALVLKGFINWYADIQLKEALNKKNFEMELALVKSQLNPHFLFNTINNIDVLIEKDAAKASLYLNKLSDMMRFMLYETKTEKVPLIKELNYLEKYIALQKIRTSNENFINFSINGNIENKFVAPMLFIPFLENAFKYAENNKKENNIEVKISVELSKIIFTCSNKYNPHNNENPHAGLGNDLIQKRLALLYPNKHNLQITDTNNTYNVTLTLYNGH